jgi:hypothetical protein
MRITIHARIESADGTAAGDAEIGAINRADDFDPASGLGLQKVMLDEQVGRLLQRAASCSQCQQPFARKDSKAIVYRTALGKVRLSSPRLYSRCAGCGTSTSPRATWSPLAEAIPDRTHPQWRWLQCRYDSVMSYQLAQIFLRHAFPGGAALPSSSVKSTVEIRRAKWLVWHGKGAKAIARIKALDAKLLRRPGYEFSTLWWNLRGVACYLRSNAPYLVNYARRHHKGLPVSSAIAGSAVNEVGSLRMAKKRQMRWSDEGAHLLAQVRVHEINGELRPRAVPIPLRPPKPPHDPEWDAFLLLRKAA